MAEVDDAGVEIIDAEVIEDESQLATIPAPRFTIAVRPGWSAEDTAVEDWLDEQRSPHTRRSYAVAIEQWRAWLAAVDCCSLGLPHRRHAFDWRKAMLEASPPLKPKTVDSRLVAARSFYDYLCDLPGSPLVVNPIKSKKLLLNQGADRPTNALARSEVRALTTAARKAGPDRRLLMLFLVVTGCRISEAINLKVGDLTRIDGAPVAMILRKGGKRGEVAVDAQVYDLIIQHVDGSPRDHHVFQPHRAGGRTGGPFTYSGAYATVRSISKAAGVVQETSEEGQEKKAKVHPHMLRATLITTCLEENQEVADVQAQVGHVKSDTTQLYNRGGKRVRRMAKISGIMAEMTDLD